MNQTKLNDVLIKTVPDEAKKEVYKTEMLYEPENFCETARKRAQDIRNRLGILKGSEQLLGDKINIGESLQPIVNDSLAQNDNDIISPQHILDINQTKYPDVPPEVIAEIRRRVNHGTPKFRVANELEFPYRMVMFFTKDIRIQPRLLRLSPETIEKIRNEVKRSKSKTQVSRKYDVSPKIVYYLTRDILIREPHKPVLYGNPLVFLQEIMKNGYAKPSLINSYSNYKMLKRKFPNLRRVSMYGDIIYFMQENSDIAMRVFLENTRRKMISYQELGQIIKVFGGDISVKDKKNYIQLMKNKYCSLNVKGRSMVDYLLSEAKSNGFRINLNGNLLTFK